MEETRLDEHQSTAQEKRSHPKLQLCTVEEGCSGSRVWLLSSPSPDQSAAEVPESGCVPTRLLYKKKSVYFELRLCFDAYQETSASSVTAYLVNLHNTGYRRSVGCNAIHKTTYYSKQALCCTKHRGVTLQNKSSTYFKKHKVLIHKHILGQQLINSGSACSLRQPTHQFNYDLTKGVIWVC